MNAKRRENQLAADTAWPHTDSADAPVRSVFKFPVDERMTR